MTLDESARRLGRIVSLERRLFEMMGRWVPSTPELSVKLALARQSRHHAGHAAALEVVLPETRDHDPAALVAATDAAGAALVRELEARADTEGRLRALVDELLPRQLAACEAFLAEASPVRDGPAIRALIFVLAEERAELAGLTLLRDDAPDSGA
jgi:hypothetical protein